MSNCQGRGEKRAATSISELGRGGEKKKKYFIMGGRPQVEINQNGCRVPERRASAAAEGGHSPPLRDSLGGKKKNPTKKKKKKKKKNTHKTPPPKKKNAPNPQKKPNPPPKDLNQETGVFPL